MSDYDNFKLEWGEKEPKEWTSLGWKSVPTFDSSSVQMALADSMLHGSFADVRLSLFNRRLPNGRVDRLRALYANTNVLKAASPYFHGLLAGGFAESSETSSSRHSALTTGADEALSTDAYEYESDSDLEDDDEGSGEIDAFGSTDGALSDESQERLDTAAKVETLVSHNLNSTNSTRIRSIVIKDYAYNTWQWLIMYLYTGQVAFAPLKSQGSSHRSLQRDHYHSEFPKYPLPCSPKSMFRLADMLGLNDLKQRAAEDIRSKLGKENILTELFSSFSSRHGDILKAQISFFEANCKNSDILPALQQKLESIVTGNMPHAAPALTSLFRVWLSMSEDEANKIETPCPVTPQYQEADISTPRHGIFRGR